MDLSNTPTTTVRHDGWTGARKAQFLEALAHDGNVRAACASVGLSREAAYRLRRRDAVFARAWAAAQMQAREVIGDVLGTRAIEGIAEEIWFHGEVVGTRRRYDTRLLLAHMARLDKLAEDEQAREDATRFDELIACVVGEPVPEELAVEGDCLPIDRATCMLMKAEEACEETSAEASDGERRLAYRRGEAAGAALWDAWHAGACATVDRLLAEPLASATPSTLSNVSTSALAGALLARRPGRQAGSANTETDELLTLGSWVSGLTSGMPNDSGLPAPVTIATYCLPSTE